MPESVDIWAHKVKVFPANTLHGAMFYFNSVSQDQRLYKLKGFKILSKHLQIQAHSNDALRACPLRGSKSARTVLILTCDSVLFYNVATLLCFFLSTPPLPQPMIVQNCKRPISQSPLKDFARTVLALSPSISWSQPEVFKIYDV